MNASSDADAEDRGREQAQEQDRRVSGVASVQDEDPEKADDRSDEQAHDGR